MSPMVVETLKLGIAILNGGNAGVQQVIQGGQLTGDGEESLRYFYLTVLTEEVAFAPRKLPTVAWLVFVLSGQLCPSSWEHR